MSVKWVGFVLVTLFSVVAFAEEGDPVIADAVIAEKEAVMPSDVDEKVQGWVKRLKLGASLALASSNKVIGQLDGLTLSFGAQIDGGLDYYRKEHEWRNSLNVLLSFAKTPAIDQLVKSADLLALESIYLYHIPSVPWIGPYFQLQYDTAMLPGYDVRGGVQNYVITPIDGSAARNVTGDSLRISDPFLPSTIKETAGFFAQPVDKKDLKVELRGGFGGRHTFADEQLSVADDDTTAVIEVNELETIHQAGPALAAEVRGTLQDERISYFAGAEVMVPLIRSPDRGSDSGFDLTNILLEAGFSVQVFRWASLDYSIRALREAQLLKDFQITNSLLLTFGWDFFGGNA